MQAPSQWGGQGADVGFTYHTGQDEAQQVATQVRALGRRVLTVQANLGEPAAAGAVVEAVVGASAGWTSWSITPGSPTGGRWRKLGWRISTGSSPSTPALRS